MSVGPFASQPRQPEWLFFDSRLRHLRYSVLIEIHVDTGRCVVRPSLPGFQADFASEIHHRQCKGQ